MRSFQARGGLRLEALETRQAPASLAPAAAALLAPAVAASLAGPAASSSRTLTGPLGGSLTVSTSQQGTHLTEQVEYTSPGGQLVFTETGVFTINPRGHSLSGTFDVTGPQGQELFSGTASVSEHGSTYSESLSLTGPGGKSAEESATVTVSAGSLAGSISLTGPGGTTRSWSFDLTR